MSGPGGRYAILDHTADVVVEARGPTMEETLAAAAEGMYAVMADPAGVREAETREVRAEGPTPEHLLERWLLDLLFLTETEGLLFRRFEVVRDGEGAIRGRARGERIDRERHSLGTAVKAVTRHGLELARDGDGWRARVLLDI